MKKKRHEVLNRERIRHMYSHICSNKAHMQQHPDGTREPETFDPDIPTFQVPGAAPSDRIGDTFLDEEVADSALAPWL